MEPIDDPQGPVALFPLPTTVFYPNTRLPLHIFEPRYRQMVSDALRGNGLIGMVLLKPGWEADYYGKPDIVSIGCVGKICRETRLPDGKFNIMLLGLRRFRILREIGEKPYRIAEIKPLREINDQPLQKGNHPLRKAVLAHYEKYLRLLPETSADSKRLDLPDCETLSQFVDQVAYQFDLPLEQKQTFLEEQDVARRVDILQSIIQMKIDLVHLSKSNLKTDFDARMN